jgi:hypothetical protein
MSTPDKATVYIDIDDEITGIIDKVTTSKERIVALVLPKRAAVLQSIVNMKLLKRAADGQKKRLVLITSETALLPLAGAAGLHVAKNLQSRPAIPMSGIVDDATEELNEGDSVSFDNLAGTESSKVDSTPDDTIDDFDSDAAAGTSIGELAGPAGVASAAVAADDMETIQLDDDAADALEDTAGPKGKKPKKDKKDKKDKKLAVPNFNRFRLALILGGLGLVVIGVVIYICATVLPKASVTITTDTSDIKTNTILTLDPKATAVKTDTGVIPAGFQQKQQSSSQQVSSTGQQNNGQVAHGSATLALTNCNNSGPVVVPAGTGLSNNGITYITQSDATLSSIKVNGKCNPANQASFYTQNVNVVAQKAGTQSNIDDGTKLSVASSNNGTYSAGDVSAKANGAIGGGTDNIVKIVSQADIDSATAKLASQDSTASKQALTSQLETAGYKAIDATFTSTPASASPSAAVGTASDTVTVTQVITYSMYGVKTSDIKDFLTAKVTKQIDPTKQSITDDGVSTATYKLASSTPVQVSITATSIAGPDIKPATVQAEVGGKKAGEITTMLKQDPGVTDVKVKLSPFWVTSAPKKASKVTVTFEKSAESNAAKP